MAFVEMDSCFVRAIRYLHSNASDSQNNLRVLLDEAIKYKYGTSKDLGPFGFYPANVSINGVRFKSSYLLFV